MGFTKNYTYKKTLLFAILLTAFGAFALQAQITITDAHIISIGENSYQAQDTLPTGINIGSGGANQTWNFAALAEDFLDTLRFRDPAGYPAAGDFPLANMVLAEPVADSSWTYLSKTSLGLFVVGVAEYDEGVLISTPVTATVITFPSTMGTNYSGFWVGDVGGIDVSAFGIGLDSLKTTRGTNVSSNIDAWGAVTTPLGTFASLRQIVIEESIDTTWEKTTATGLWTVISPATIALITQAGFSASQYEYDTLRTAKWWSDDVNVRFPLIEMEYETNGDAIVVDWLETFPAVGINKSSLVNDVALYPNPASTEITLTTELIENNSIAILDVTGKLVKEISFTTNKINISVSELDNGIYFYNIYDANGNVLHSNKFVVAK